MSTKKHDVPDALLASLLAAYKKPEDLMGENGLVKQLPSSWSRRALDVEMAAHPSHGKNEPVANAAGNTRNARAARPSRASLTSCPSKYPATVTATSSRI